MGPEARDHGCPGDYWAIDAVSGEFYCMECRALMSDIESSKINAAVDAAKEREMEGL